MDETKAPASLRDELQRAMDLDVGQLAAAIETIGFSCTRCGACCTAPEDENASATTDEHTATVFPDEVRTLMDATSNEWRDVARPVPYGLTGDHGETFEWALQTDGCGDCAFYEESDGTGACTVHPDRPLICRTYPFSIALAGTNQPQGEPVTREGQLRAHECEGLGNDIGSEDARALARTLKRRAIEEITQSIDLLAAYEPAPRSDGIVVHDSEGAKRPDGRPL